MTTTRTAAQQAHTVNPDRDVIVLGVDGSERNRAAITWAENEAAESHSSVMLVSALTGLGEDLAFEASATTRLRTLAKRFPGHHVVHVEAGPASKVLVEQAEGSALVVVGKRGLGAMARMLVGSTSIAVAGRSPAPVVVVPDTWDVATRAGRPIVVGVEVHEGAGTGPVCRDASTAEFAFERAQQLRVPVAAVSAWDIPTLVAWSPSDIAERRAHQLEVLRQALHPWTERFPEVEVIMAAPAENPTDAILDAATTAQMVVLGRHTGPAHLGGFTLGSTARGVLHYADVPVVVVPSEPVADPGSNDPVDGAAPMF